MIEREFVNQKKREFQVRSYIAENLKNVGHSFTEIKRTPLGDKVVIHASRPGLIVGRKGQNIEKLTKSLKNKFKLENPQIEINEVERPELDASIVAERIASTLERFGSNRFKSIMHKTLSSVLGAGALGVEVRVSGKLPSSRAKSWRVYGGNLKKCGDAALIEVRKAKIYAKLKSGVVGIQVRILPSGATMPDKVSFKEEEKPEEKEEKKSEEKPSKEKKKSKMKDSKEKKTEKKTEKKKDSKESSKKRKNENNERTEKPEGKRD